jgi:hypothetical protein
MEMRENGVYVVARPFFILATLGEGRVSSKEDGFSSWWVFMAVGVSG